jgi:von Willebrand factor type A domain
MMTRSALGIRWGALFAASAALLGTLHCGGGDSADESGGKGGKGGTSGNGGSLNLDGSAASGGTTVIDPDAACATTNQNAALTPVDMLIMFDRSGSMNQNNKWPQASNALIAFFQDPGTAGLRVALRFFPHDLPVPGCSGGNGGACDANACSQVLVALGALSADPAPTDAQEQALVSAVQGNGPGNGGGTPMYAALSGAEMWAAATQQQNPGDKVVVILVTDGAPNGCDEDINHIASLAASAFSSSGILTYAVGLEGSNNSDMDAIAQAGGTANGIFIGAGNAQQELLAALKAIQGSAVSCNIPYPTSQGGTPLDPTKINVNYTPGGGGAMQTIGQVQGASECANGGWYYDNPTTPTVITLCPSTCSTIQGDSSAKLEVLIGCASQPQNPPQ